MHPSEALTFCDCLLVHWMMAFWVTIDDVAQAYRVCGRTAQNWLNHLTKSGHLRFDLTKGQYKKKLYNSATVEYLIRKRGWSKFDPIWPSRQAPTESGKPPVELVKT